MKQEKRIAFCITCKGRTQHLKVTLPKNLADNEDYKNCVFVILDYGSPDDLQQYLATEHQQSLNSGKIVVYYYPTASQFRMAHAKNMAHRCGIREGAEILVNLDADNFTGRHFARYINETLELRDEYLAIGKMIPGVMPRGITGRIIVHKDMFINVGGYDERFGDWSPDDKDFDWRLRRMGCHRYTLEDRFMDCIRHNDKMRFKEYPHLRHIHCNSNELYIKEATHRVVNFGVIGCGVVYRNYDFIQRYHIKPIPTRIFGIGMHKTGTTSLHEALNIMNLDCAHWPSAHWAKAVWNEMQEGSSKTLEKHYSACDLPITLLYKELDIAYPNSKFILTLRDEGEWLDSVERHWNPEYNEYRKMWDTDPFTHKVHSLLYGRKKFDRDIFLARYRKHTADVLNYFKDRHNDLLVLTTGHDNSWDRLCEFLNLPIPNEPYPRLNFSAVPKDKPLFESLWDDIVSFKLLIFLMLLVMVMMVFVWWAD